MGPKDYVLLAILALCVIFAVRHIWKNGGGCGGCTGDCSRCHKDKKR